ncbi:DUF7856 family protein [Halorubrum sp. FL23]|uniref:DUF7856 family protein n=1 Tax=Halorubrum sp. FL23 TaxID=3458704 RepID=UPI0040349E20
MTGADGQGDPERSDDASESTAADAVDPGPAVADPAAVIGRVPTEAGLRRELAAAARTLGLSSSIEGRLIELRNRVAAIEVEPVDLDAARRRVADASGEEERLKERVAALRGGVQARREIEAETDEALDELQSAAAELSTAQSERIAAEQALRRARTRAADARDARERRLELRDRLRNRRRDARRELAREVYPSFRDALAAVPGVDVDDAGADPGAYDGPSLAASLAAVRIADLDGAVVLGAEALGWIAERGGSAPESVLDGPVVRPCGRPRL